MPTDNPATTPKRSIFSLLFGALLRPKSTFGYLKDNRKKMWWLAALCIILLTVAPTVSTVAVMQRQAQSMMLPSAASSSMEPGVSVVEGDRVPVESFEEPGMTGAPGGLPAALSFLPAIGAVVGAPIGWLLWGGALYLVSVFLGRSSGFRDMFRLAVWARLPFAVRGLVQTVYILLSGELIVNKGLSGFAPTANANPLLPPSPGHLALTNILQSVDIYLVWNLLLIVAGLVAFTGLSRKKGWIATLSIWLIFTLVSIIPALIGGMVLG